jgi:hypothetical protein
VKRSALNRRTLLRGAIAGGVVGLALPPLEAMFNANGNAYADGTAIPRRMLTWVFGNGCRLAQWVPSDQGANFTLSEELAPLANVKDYLSVLTGFRNYVAGRRGHHDGMAGLFSGHPFIQLDAMGAPYASKFGGRSVDQLAADHIGNDTYYRSLQVGVTKRHLQDQGPTLQTLSHRSPDEPMQAERDPQKLYDKLFISLMPTDEGDPTDALRANALDAVTSDAARLRMRLGATDRARLDAHLDGISQLQKQLLAIPQSCDLPAKPPALDYNPDGSEPLYEINEAMSKLVAMAFSCDLTRVVSFMFTGPSGGTHFHMLPPSEFPSFPTANDYSHADQHQVSHMNLTYEQEFIHRSVVVSIENLAFLLETLKNTPEGAGNLLDNTCVLAGSGVAEGWNHSELDYPLIVAGHAGGRLKSGVGHYRSTSEESLSDVGFACLKSVLDDPDAVTEYGSDSGNYTGYTTTPCAAIYNG